jgi:hypothetical protein
MRRNRLYCGACGARKSAIEIIAGVPKAKCRKCGAAIPMCKDAYGNWHPVAAERLELVGA